MDQSTWSEIFLALLDEVESDFDELMSNSDKEFKPSRQTMSKERHLMVLFCSRRPGR